MPATLAYVRSNGARGSSPGLQAYPNFRTNELHVSSSPCSIDDHIISFIHLYI